MLFLSNHKPNLEFCLGAFSVRGCLGSGFIFFRAFLGTGCLLSRAFPITGCMFSRAYLGTGCMFSRACPSTGCAFSCACLGTCCEFSRAYPVSGCMCCSNSVLFVALFALVIWQDMDVTAPVWTFSVRTILHPRNVRRK